MTSSYTLDAQSTKDREYLGKHADLVGAIRLPNNAFKNAGTDVVSDIIFLQKREFDNPITPDWVNVGKHESGVSINQYFLDHPEMILGSVEKTTNQFGNDVLTVKPYENEDLSSLLDNAIQNIKGHIDVATVSTDEEEIIESEEIVTVPADDSVKNYSFAIVNDEVYYREDSVMERVKSNDKPREKERLIGLINLRDTEDALIDAQLNGATEDEIHDLQSKLNEQYDSFTKEFGLINRAVNGKAFDKDSSYYRLCALENLDEKRNFVSKADMFNKQTIRPNVVITHVDTPMEALGVSIGEKGKVDLPYMAQLLGTPDEYDDIIKNLQGVIFHDPSVSSDVLGWQSADEYLSGNVRNKLKIAKEKAINDERYQVNVEALEKVQPQDLKATEIDANIGSTWIPAKIYEEFMFDKFEPPYYTQDSIHIRYNSFDGMYTIQKPNRSSWLGNIDNVNTTFKYGTDKVNAYKILERALNLGSITIHKSVWNNEKGDYVDEVDQKETAKVSEKMELLKQEFKEWLWEKPERRDYLVKLYNEKFNCIRPREYDGSHIQFVGMNPSITLREHQKNAVAHTLYGGNTLLAHVVGAGKTYEMCASAMEAKRLGLCNKTLIAVPNNIVQQFGAEFLQLYPNANLLIATKKDFQKENRKKFSARIATGDYDAIIMSHTQLEKLPISEERQKKLLQDELKEVKEAKEKAGKTSLSTKRLAGLEKTIRTRLLKLANLEAKDDVIEFEKLGVDRLMIDEAHNFKNLDYYTKMQVSGLNGNPSQRATDLLGKCRYIDEITGGKGIVFATGTPVSNSVAELYVMQKYLQADKLKELGIYDFDSWATTFGETVDKLELDTSATKYINKKRFAKYINLPELMNLFKECADIKTADQLDLPIPKSETETIVSQPSEFQKALMKDLSDRADKIRNHRVEPTVDNMPKISTDGRKIGLDQRVMDDMLPDYEDSKVNKCVSKVFDIWHETKDQKLTQLIFCDMSVPKKGEFNVYDDIKQKLISKGVPEDEIAFVHDAKNEKQKQAMFDMVNAGSIRVLLGSTDKMGTGTNCQRLLYAVHHLDVKWRPSDYVQRNGRIVRQGNTNHDVKIYNYVTDGTFDAYMWQTLETKSRFINQIMTSKSPVRSYEDEDTETLNYAQVKALCAGDPRIKEKMELDIDVAKLESEKANYKSQLYDFQDKLHFQYPQEKKNIKERIKVLEDDQNVVQEHPAKNLQGEFVGMKVNGVTYTTMKDAGEAILRNCEKAEFNRKYRIGKYRGFDVSITFDNSLGDMSYKLVLDRPNVKRPLGTELKMKVGKDPSHLLTSMNLALDQKIQKKLEVNQVSLTKLEEDERRVVEEIEKPFAKEDILQEKKVRLNELNVALRIQDNNEQDSVSTQMEMDKKEEYRKSVADQFLKLLDKENPVDAFAWVKQWQFVDMPRSLITGKEYSGTNSYLLKMEQMVRGYNDPRWITFLECEQFEGAHVKKEEHGTEIQRWLVMDKTKTKGEAGAIIDFPEMNRLIKDGRDENDFAIFPEYYEVFNAEQCEGLPPLENELHNDIKQDDYVSKVVESMNVPIYNNGGDNAYYRPDEDAVHLPQKEVFKSSYAYNATALHELAHASGADTRLQRSGINDCNCFDDKQYGYEELIAEMTACFAAANLMSDETGMDEYIAAHAENHYKYVKSWAESIRADPNILIDAMDEAQLAADFLDVHGGVMDIADFNKKNYDWKIAKDDFGDVILQSKNKAVESFDICDNVNVITQTKERHR